jgi:ABC-2 type transport system permease protein
MGPWTGFALLCGYAVVLVAAGAWRLRRGDA